MRQWIALFENAEPEMMSEPRVLYRSISIPELISVAFRGEVTGGGNTFSGDNRRWVFFGDELNRNLIAQGEDHTRYPGYALRHDPIHAKFRATKQDIEEIGFLAVNVLKSAARRKQWSAVTPEFLDKMTWDESTARRARSDYGRYDPGVKQALDDLVLAFADQTTLRDQYQALHNVAKKDFRSTRENWAYTSAVLVTKPIDDGYHFTADSGESMHDGDEYGFYPGTVTLSDIDYILLYRDGVEEKRITDMDTILPTLTAGGIDTHAFMQ